MYNNIRSNRLYVDIKKECSEELPYTDSWLNNFDFDWDCVFDPVSFDFTGGAHCCYRPSLVLSSYQKTYNFPFEIDGGYISGPDYNQPEQFFIKDFDNDGLPEIFLMIDTYNGKPNGKLPEEWSKKFNIKSNWILIEYVDKSLIVRDYNNN